MLTQVSESEEKQVRPHRAKRAFFNVLSNWGSYALAMGINFFLSPYVVKHLGNTGYGVWTLTVSLTGYLGLLDLGVRGAVTRYIAKFHTQRDHKEASRVASSALVIFSVAGLVAMLTSLILAGAVVGKLKIPSDYLHAAQIVLLITGINIATSLVNGVYGGVVVGLQRFDLTNAIEAMISILRGATIVAALHFGYGIIALAVLQLAFTVLRWLANVGLTRHLYPEVRVRFSEADRAGLRLIFSFSIFSFLLHVSGSLIYATDNVVIGAVLPVTAVAFYAIGGNLVEYTRTLVAGISQTMTPMASSTEAQADHERLQKVVLFSSRAGSMVVLPIAVTFMLRGSRFIGLWMGPQYSELSGKVLFLLSLTLVFWAANSVTAGSLLGLSKHKPLVPASLFEGLFNLVLSIILVKRMGIAGVALGTVIPNWIMSLTFWPWYIKRTLGIPVVTYAHSAWIRPILGIIPFGIATYAIELYWPATHMVPFFLQVGVALPLAAAGFWMMCLDRERREDISRRFAGFYGRVLARS